MLNKYCAGALLSLSVVLSACSTAYKPGIHEVFQVPEDTQFYTASTLWYTNPEKMTSMNYQKGQKIRYGSEVNDIDYTDDSVSFTVKDTNVQHEIALNKNLTLLRMPEYLKKVFMVKNPVEIELETDPVVFEKIRRGIVEPGMTKEQVLMAYGYPSKHRTSDTILNTWIYEEDRSESKRVVFRSGKVFRIIKN